ncbi:MAG TPA: MFS transporter [Stellaceae bacterium]|nr:MFS transporter [Stellaceae bacterium]
MPDAGENAEDRSTGIKPSRHVLIFLAARFAVSAAWQMQGVALGWYVYALTDSALALGLIGLVQFTPMIGLALPAGHIVDRHARRAVAVTAYAIEGSCSLALAVMAYAGAGGAVAVFAVIACYGVGRAFEQPAMQSWLPTLVPAHAFPRVAAANSLASQAAVIVGPAMGGLLYLLGPFVPFVAAAVLQGSGLVALSCVASPHSGAREPVTRDSLLGGVRFIWRNEAVLAVITLDFLCVVFGGATALMPIFARDILAVGPAGLGLLRSAPAVGALVIGIALTRRPPRRRIGAQLLVAIAIYGVATVAFGLSRSFALSLAALVVVGAADMLSVVIRQTMVQLIAPDAIRGRITAITGLFTGASNQLGQFESGVTAAWFGPVASVVLGGFATLGVVAVCARRFPAVRRMDRFAMAEAAVDMPRAAVPGSPSRP